MMDTFMSAVAAGSMLILAVLAAFASAGKCEEVRPPQWCLAMIFFGAGMHYVLKLLA